MTSAPRNARTTSAFNLPTLPILVGFVLRMSLLWLIHRDHDAHQYLFFPTSHEAWNVAWSMALGRGFSSPLAGMHGPTAWVAPGYPWLIAAMLWLTGNDAYSAVILCLSLNCLVAALTCWPIYEIGKRIASDEVAILSCWIWVFLPTAVIFPLEWLWDPSFSAFLVALLVYWTLDLPAKSSMWSWASYGLVWGVALLLNPAAGILFPFFLIWAAERRWRNRLPWWPQVVLASFALILCLAPWTVRNYRAFGKVVPIKDNFGLEFWLGNNPGVKRSWSPDLHPVGYPHEMDRLLLMGETAYMQTKQREALAFIRAHPGDFLKFSLERVADTWMGFADVPSDRWITALRIGTLYIWITSVFSLLSLGGLYLAWRASAWETVPVWIAPLFFPLTYYISHSMLRYRHPIDPALCILVASALVHAHSVLFRRPTSIAGRLSPDSLEVTGSTRPVGHPEVHAKP